MKNNRELSFIDKIKTIDELALLVEKFKKQGKVVVHCHGVFDLLHPGHIRHFEAARERGDALVVTVTQDQYVNKGPGRPVFNQRLRAESIAALQCVDYVAVNEWPTAVPTIKKLKPNFYVKGSDYAKRDDDVTGKIYDEEEAIKSVGGKIYFTDDITFSSTALLNVHFNVFPQEAESFLQKFKKNYVPDDMIRRIKSFNDLNVLVVGDTIIDEYHYCSGIGKPPKDNIIATKFLHEERFAGGSLAIANHVAGFAKSVHLVSMLGGKNRDDYKDFIASKLKPKVKAKFFTKKDAMTVVKRRFLDPSFLTKMFEIYFIKDELPLEKKFEQEIIHYLNQVISHYDVVIVSDFGHGFISPAIVSVLCTKAKFLAVNTQTNSANAGYNLITKYRRADYVCIDEPELRLAMRDRFADLEQLVLKLAKTIRCKKVTITRGHRGSLVYMKKEGFTSIPVFSKEIVDRTGAGDACLSLSSLAAFKNCPTQEIGFICNAVGALAVLIVGNRESIEQVPLFKFITTLLK